MENDDISLSTQRTEFIGQAAMCRLEIQENSELLRFASCGGRGKVVVAKA